jgi:hypothetical protein
MSGVQLYPAHSGFFNAGQQTLLPGPGTPVGISTPLPGSAFRCLFFGKANEVNEV